MKKIYSKLLLLTAMVSSTFVYSQQGRTTSFIKFGQSEKHQVSNAKALIREKLDLSFNESLSKIKTEQDEIGFIHDRYQQYVDGIKVEFGTYIVHSKDNLIKSMNGQLFATANLDLTPSLSSEQGFEIAINHTGAEKYLWEYPEAAQEMDNYQKPTGELVVLPGMVLGSKEARLAYRYDIYALKPLSRGDLYIDAHSGKVLFFNAIIKHADNHGYDGRTAQSTLANTTALVATTGAATRYSGNRVLETTNTGSRYTLNDAGRKVYTRNANHQASGSTYPYVSNYTEFTDNDNNWTAAEYHNVNKDDAALDAHWGAMMTYDYFQNQHGRNSYDNAGASIRSYIHVDNNYDNAFWNGSVMSYGDGSSNGTEGNGYFDALTSIDVAGHEIGHAVCENTANLAYQRESGAMNEGFSDIWGASIEHFAKGNGNDLAPDATIWLIGDEIDRRSGSAALRSMSNPTSLGQPDTYGGANWQEPNCGTPTRTNDYCGVHTNSGVLNHWFYLLSVGGSGTNDIGNAFSVSAIGMTKSAKITYRLESNYLTSSSTYADARTGAIQAAIDLYGTGSTEEIATTNAWHAVGVGSAYGSISYCTSKGNSVNDEYIGKVQLNTINNSSNGNGGYTDFTAISTDLTQGASYTITVTPTWTGTVYSEGYAVWIDYNADGDFDDTGELVWSKTASKTTPVSGTFSIPTSANTGATRMRISMKYNGIPTACEAFNYGEVEDYTVNITGSTLDTQAPSTPTSLTASNATQTTIDLAWAASTDNVAVTGYDIYKDGALYASTTGTSKQVAGLTASTTYGFYVKAKDAAGNISGASNTANATTTAVPSSSCTGQVSSYPYNESFENTIGLWSQDTADNFDWSLKSGSTPSSNTGPSSANEGSYYIYMESSSPNYSTKRAILNSPCYDFSAETQATLTFDYHMYGASAMGSLALEASTNNGVSWTSIWSKSGNQGDSWKSASIDLASYSNGTVKLRFNGVTGTTWQGDMAIDNLSIATGTTGGSCTATTLTITFDNYPEETSWDIKDSTGTVVFFGGTYASQADGSTLTIPNCLDSGCYTFTMKDTYNDGMCCSYGNGSFSLSEDATGTVLASGGSFTSTSATNFCIGTAAINGLVYEQNIVAQEMEQVEINIFPNPANDIINVSLRDSKMKQFTIISMMGQIVLQGEISKENIDISSLKKGIYIIEFSSNKKKLVSRIIKK
jgi:Zn-dependent metalloprotease